MTTLTQALKRLSSPSHPPILYKTPSTTPQAASTTIKYTVSTRPRNSSTILHHLGICLRILIGITVLFVWGVKAGCWYRYVGSAWLAESGGEFEKMGTWGMVAGIGTECVRWAIKAAEGWKGGYVLGVGIGVLWMVLKRGYKEESLTVIRSLGLQTSTTSALYLRSPTTRFIPTTSIQDVFIHEAFKGFEVKFYMAVLVAREKEAVVVFPRLLPRREILEEVWRGTRACLWGVGERGG